MNSLICTLLPLLTLAAPDHYVPPSTLQADDYTVLHAADGQYPAGPRSPFAGHGKFPLAGFKLGWSVTWEREVVAAGDYEVNVLYQHAPKFPLRVTVTAGATKLETVSKPGGQAWRRLRLPGVVNLAAGRQMFALTFADAEQQRAGELQVMSLELVRPAVRQRLHESALRLRAQADTAGFRALGYGLMVHWTSTSWPRTGERGSYEAAVNAFDVNRFAADAARTGARFVTLTTSHAEQYVPAPLKSLDALLPGRTTQRDLLGELADALGKQGLKLFVYYHLGASSDPRWLAASGFWETDTRRFFDNWCAIVGELGERYGSKLAGFWFDDGAINYYYRSAPWERLLTAALKGHPGRLVAFNPWELPSATEFQSYFCGEGMASGSLFGQLKPDGRGTLLDGSHAGLQASVALTLDDEWVHERRDTEVKPPRFSAEQLVALLREARRCGNVPMLNVGCYRDSLLAPATVNLLAGVAQTLAGDRLPPPPLVGAAPLFNGRDLTGWEGDAKTWRVEDGCITAGDMVARVPRNEFLATTKGYENFDLSLQFRLQGTEGFVNSGVQVRSVRIPNHFEMFGYQADIGAGWYGALYDESRRNAVISPVFDPAALAGVLKPGEWNEYRIRAEGPRLRLWLNGVLTTDFTETNAKVPLDGLIALQIHGGGKTKVQFKDLQLAELPPTPGAPTWAAQGGYKPWK